MGKSVFHALSMRGAASGLVLAKAGKVFTQTALGVFYALASVMFSLRIRDRVING